MKREFDGKVRLEFHLAPPLLAKRDAMTGHLLKRSFGPWMLGAFALLKRFRFLRGTSLDPFGRTAERRMERQLIADYEAALGEIVAGLNPENHVLAVELAALPERIRGFGHVKERAVADAKTRATALLAAFRSPVPTATAAE